MHCDNDDMDDARSPFVCTGVQDLTELSTPSSKIPGLADDVTTVATIAGTVTERSTYIACVRPRTLAHLEEAIQLLPMASDIAQFNDLLQACNAIREVPEVSIMELSRWLKAIDTIVHGIPYVADHVERWMSTWFVMKVEAIVCDLHTSDVQCREIERVCRTTTNPTTYVVAVMLIDALRHATLHAPSHLPLPLPYYHHPPAL